jgi:hypothetical protein
MENIPEIDLRMEVNLEGAKMKFSDLMSPSKGEARYMPTPNYATRSKTISERLVARQGQIGEAFKEGRRRSGIRSLTMQERGLSIPEAWKVMGDFSGPFPRELGPTRAEYSEKMILEMIKPRQHVMTQQQLEEWVKPTQRAMTLEEMQATYGKGTSVEGTRGTYAWEDVKMGSMQGPTRDILNRYLMQERQAAGSRLFISDAYLSGRRSGMIQLPDTIATQRPAYVEESIRKGRQREAPDRAMGSIPDTMLKQEQMRVPDVMRFTQERTRGVPERPFIPTFEEPGGRTERPRPYVPHEPEIPRPVEPVPPVPTIPDYPPPPPPIIKIPDLSPIGGSGGGGGGLPRGGYAFVEWLSFSSGAYDIAMPRAPRMRASRKPPASTKRTAATRRKK